MNKNLKAGLITVGVVAVATFLICEYWKETLFFIIWLIGSIITYNLIKQFLS